MGQEIERKFLVCGDGWRAGEKQFMRQGYILAADDRSIRIRIADDRAMLTIKGGGSGLTRSEFEYAIPLSDAENILRDMAIAPCIEKDRYVVLYRGHRWEVDEFLGANKGLVVAEIELDSEDQVFEKPDWLGKEVSGDPRFLNASLTKVPYGEWEHS